MKLSERAVAIATTFTLAGLLASAITTASAQVQPQPSQQPPDSVVAVVADAQGLPFVPPDQRPVFGTFWDVHSSLPCLGAPLPFPPLDPATPVYAIGDPAVGGQFLVDVTAGQVISPQAQYNRRALTSMTTASIVQAQADELQTFVAQVQARQAYAQLRASGQMSLSEGPPIPGEGGGGTNGWEGGGTTFDAKFYTTNDLWLEIVTLTNATGFFIVHPPEAEAATGVYDLFMTTNLSPNVPGLNLTNWLWLLRTDPGETNLIVPDLWADQAYFMLGRTNDTDGDGMSDAYEHLVSHTSPTNADAPTITFQPLSQDVVAGDTATFTVAASGPAPLAHQWMLNGTNIVGETNASLSLGNVVWDQAGDYSVRVTSPVGLSVISSNATLWVEDPWGWYFDHAPTYIPILSSRQDFTFKNGFTYVIISPIQFYGRTTIQGGATIKFDTWQSSTIQIMGTLLTDAKPYLPAILTCVDDDGYGDYVDWSNDAPAMRTNGVAYLDLTFAQDAQPAISNLRLSYADQAATIPAAAGTLDVWDCQFLQCNAALANTATNAAAMGRLHNVLLAGCQAAASCSGTNVTITGEHVTADVTDFSTGQAQPARIGLTNSIILGSIPGGSALVTDHCAINPTAPVFQTNAAGFYYLTDGSAHHRAGTTSISQRLLSALQQKSTQPPLALPALLSIAGELTLGPQVSRYTNGAPDYGFYYDALDYTITWMTNRGKITVLPGTAIGFRKEYSPTLGHLTWLGLDLREGSAFVSQGTPTKPTVFTDIQFVQEQQQFPCSAFFMFDFWPNDSGDQAPSVDLRFCNFYASSDANLFWSGYDAYYDYIYSPDSLVNWTLQDCNLHTGRITLGQPTGAVPDWVYGSGAVSWKNNLFDRVAIDLDPTLYEFNSVVNCDLSLDARNNLFLGGRWFRMQPIPAAAGNWVFKDNLFDKTDFIQNTNSPLDFNYNAYWPLSTSELAWDWYIYPWYEANTNQLCATTNGGGGNEKFFSTAPPYQRGPLGDHYLPITTPLYHAGSRTATDASLYHYTTRADQTKEGSGQLVNIGLHYVATAGSGISQPKDTDSDGIPDFIENASGTGTVGPNETDWQTAYTLSGVYDPTNAVYDHIDLSGNGLVGRIKTVLGMGPFDAANPLALKPIALDPQWGVMTYELPIRYDVLTNIGGLNLNMNGIDVSLEDFGPATNGNSLLNWNTTYEPPGLHFVQARIMLNGTGDDSAVLKALGTLAPFYSDNLVQFFESDSIFDDTSAFLDAELPAQNANYTISLYDPSTAPPTFITAITNSTSSGMIQEDWNLTYSDGITPFTGGAVDAVFDVTLLDYTGGTATAQKQHAKKLNRIPNHECVSGDCLDGFDLVYMYTPTNSSMASAFYHGDVWYGMQGVVDILTMPEWPWDVYYSYFNIFGWPTIYAGYPGYVTSQATVTNLLYPDMANGTTKNFYCHAHGTPTSLANTDNSAHMYSWEVAKQLANEFNARGLCPTNPYRFVFLDGCSTAGGKAWRRAFGIMPIWATTQVARYKLGPQAFVGWATNVSDQFGLAGGDATLGTERATAYTETLQWFYADWMNGASLAQCIANASDTNLVACPLPVPQVSRYVVNGHTFTNNWPSKIYVVGHSGLTVNGLTSQDDNKFVSPIDIDTPRR